MKQTKPKLAFVGLGVMGYPMAGHLVRKGYQVSVFNRTQATAEKWLEEYGDQAGQCVSYSSPREAAQQADVIFSCVGNDDDLKAIMLGEQGIFADCREGTVICDHTTSSASLARELNEKAKSQGLGFLDAPVSGGQAGAENGALSIMVGGEKQAFDSVVEVMQCYGKTVRLLGGPGSGQLSKMVNQICIAGILQGLSEALHFGERSGLDMKQVVEVISQGAAQSWQMDNRAVTMIDNKFDFGFAVDWMRKDLKFVLDEAQAMGLQLDLTQTVSEYYDQVSDSGGGRLDTSSLITRLKTVD